jgi:cupin fold WbuC family metalloprotein
MIINEQILDKLSEQAKNSPRLRMAMDLRNTPDDQSQRMLNALEPGTVMPIHRHLASSETVALLRGKIRWYFYNDNGDVDEEVVLDANGDVRCINVEKGGWHSLECLESGSVLLESKDGKYEPLREGELMNNAE